MNAFSHGCVVNFQESVREMFASDLDRLINDLLKQSDAVLLGTIDLEKEELHLYGHARTIQFDEQTNRCEIVFTTMEEQPGETIRYSLEDLVISHEALFDIVDEGKGQVSYRVLYVTFANPESGQETTYFLADENAVSHPLACVAEFWQQVSEVGRDVDFNLSGCSAYDLNRM
ncbi:hypothetical protein ACFO25_08410 [Paenactinomyces guangxiensis]|uniref:Uncharacterized protein n=1 Tax=Paenactinomyces guangxiensis TaxID=1490290 RepID=A0A7W2A7M2_9BACL|nr:hypothetical protein [Paenactinomyces guangxiensis]MBA4492933.1 hypothetical protein [Paenactinomyces guangxiensis]MBH8590218.1 hypothetical protein [Paenactinomyces guangxiensis]